MARPKKVTDEAEQDNSWDDFVSEVKEKCNRQGRAYNLVYHPDPQENFIKAEWDVEVKTGNLLY